MVTRWWHRLTSVLRRSHQDEELDREITFHIDMLTAQYRKRGMAPTDARQEALRAFGASDLVKADVRDAWFSTVLDNFARDIRFGLRRLVKSPGYSLVVVLVMALGIGANTAIFSVVNGVLLRPLPYANGDQLVELHQHRPQAADSSDIGFSAQEIADYQTAATLQGVVEYHNMWFILLGRAEPERVATGVVSASYFDVLGVKPLYGRTFRAEDDHPGAPAVLVLSHRYWQRSFGGDPNVVGRFFRMNDRPHQVIGVLPPLPQYPDENDVFMPTSACPFRSRPAMATNRDQRMTQAFARIKPGVRLEEAQADVSVVAAAMATAYPDSYPAALGGLHTTVSSLKDELTQAFEPTLVLLLGTAAFVLLIVCASVANLLLARLSRQEREMAVRTALGAPRSRLLRQVLTESAMLSLAGGVVGLAFASAALRLLVAFAARFTTRADEISIDQTVLLFTLAMSLLTGIVFGCIPALTAQHDTLPALREGNPRATGGRQRLRSGLIVAQVAISFVLLIGAGLMARSFLNLERVDPGFEPRNVLTARLDLNFTKYNTPALRAAFYRRLLLRLAEDPEVEAVAASATFPLNGTELSNLQFRIADRALPEGAQPPLAGFRSASADYFRTMGIPLISGRVFTDRDDLENPDVVVINQSLARHFFPGEDPIGRRVSADGGESWATIVGVVADTRQRLDRDAGDEIYASVLQAPQLSGSWLIKTRIESSRMAQNVRAAVRDVDPEQPVDRFRTLDQVREASLAPPRLTTMLLTMFAGLAMLVTAAGMAGVVAYSVSQRTQEFGIRMALGARRETVVAMVVGQGVMLVAIGLAIGALGAVVLSSLMSVLLFGVSSIDVLTYAIVAALLTLVALVACYLPARRAASVDPLIALKSA
jgi:predicted permease